MDFGRCPCSGQIRASLQPLTIASPAGDVIIADFPSGECENCQTFYVKAGVLAVMERA